MTKKELLKLEKSVWEDDCEYWSPYLVLDLIDEIKRLKGWRILERPSHFQPRPSLTPVQFDFSEVE